ncbi:Global transcription regulator sge1 [Lecanora helva]
MPASERMQVDRPATWLSPLSVTSEERPALLEENKRSYRSSQRSAPTPIADSPVSLADVRLSDALATAHLSLDEDYGIPPFTSAHKAVTNSGTAPVGAIHGQLLAPTYFGHLGVKEDALRLLEGSFQGILHQSFRDPQGVISAIRSGNVFLWEQEISAIQHGDDEMSWINVHHDDDFLISREAKGKDGLWRRTIIIPARGRRYHFVSYYKPWDTVNGTLKAPSEDYDLRSMNLRSELASQLITSKPWTEHCRLLKVKPSISKILRIRIAYSVKESSTIGRLQFMRSTLLLCLSFADEVLYGNLLQRKAEDWFPHVRSDLAYWHELSRRDIFRGMKPQKLKTQITKLLRSLIYFSNGWTASRLPRSQPSDEFSGVQNRSLFGEIFRISHCGISSPKPLNAAKLSKDLARSVLFDQNPRMDPTRVTKWRDNLMLLLRIDPPAHGVSVGFLEQVSIKDCEEIRMISRFPRFDQASNYLPLFLVACQSTHVSRKFAELLHDWSLSAHGIQTYHCLVKIIQKALPSDELMLCLSALAAFQSIMRGTESDDTKSPKPVQLVDFLHHLTEENAIRVNRAVLGDMVWSFLHAVTHALSPNAHPHYLEFLGRVIAAASTSDPNNNRFLDQYWMKRLLTPLSHGDAIAEVEKTVQSVPTPVRPPVEYTESEKRLSIIADDRVGDETYKYSTTSTRVDNVPLGEQTEDGCSIRNPEHHTSVPWWLTFPRVLRIGVCIGRSG